MSFSSFADGANIMKGECELALKIEREWCEVVTKNDENLCEIMPKSEEVSSELVPKIEEDLSMVVTEYDEIEWETVTVTVYKEEECEAVLRNENDPCDFILPKGFEVKSSSLHSGVLGVFTLLGIENNFHFGSYIGERLELHEKESAFKSQHYWLVSNF